MRRPEDKLQRDSVAYLRLVLPSSHYQVAAIPNGGRRGPIECAMLKATGLLTGVADVVIFGPNGRCWLLEFKAGKGKLTPSQTTFQAFCAANNVPYVVARSVDDVSEAIAEWRIAREAA